MTDESRKTVPYVVRWRKAFRGAAQDVYCVAVGMTLATYADPQGMVGPPSPSLRTLAENCGIVPNTALSAVDRLEGTGWVQTTRRKRHYIHYRLTFGVSPEETDHEDTVSHPKRHGVSPQETDEVFPFDDSCLTRKDTVKGPVSHEAVPVYHHEDTVSHPKRHGVSSEPYREEVRKKKVVEEGSETREAATPLRSEAPLRRRLEKKSKQRQKIAPKEKTITGPDGRTYRVKP